MKKQNLIILGSTGSIGNQALEIAKEHSERFSVSGLSCNTNWQKLAEQVNHFQPEVAVLVDDQYLSEFKKALSDEIKTEILTGTEALNDLAAFQDADVVLNSLVGFAGFEPTCRALKSGKKVALANKESLVVGGALIHQLLNQYPGTLVPVDSEHSAMLQCLVGEPKEKIKKLIITASGGPFRSWSYQQMRKITVDQALDHPNWSMGAKITIDSATMMNKGLEIIEAHWLFDLPLSKIEAVVHPQSIIHSIVEFVDGSSKAQLGPPTMKVPILYALTYPDRLNLNVPTLDWEEAFDLTFEPVDYERFPCMKLAVEAISEGDFKPAVLNAANEIAVQRFLNKEIPYIGIAEIIETCLNRINMQEEISIQTLKEIDRQTREFALTI